MLHDSEHRDYEFVFERVNLKLHIVLSLKAR